MNYAITRLLTWSRRWTANDPPMAANRAPSSKLPKAANDVLEAAAALASAASFAVCTVWSRVCFSFASASSNRLTASSWLICIFAAAARYRGDAAEGGETTADNPANHGGEQIDGQQRCDAPCDQPVQHAVEAYLNSRQPGGNVTSQPESDAAADDPPHSGANT